MRTIPKSTRFYLEITRKPECYLCKKKLAFPKIIKQKYQIIKCQGHYIWYIKNEEIVCEETYTVDHIIPRSKGGTNESKNLAICCNSCNTGKGNAYSNNMSKSKPGNDTSSTNTM